MTINRSDLYRIMPQGFSPQFFDDAVTIQRWEKPEKDDRKAECNESPMYLRGEAYVSYTISVPKPRPPVCTGTGIIVRMSAHRYKVALTSPKAAIITSCESLNEIAQLLREFFGE